MHRVYLLHFDEAWKSSNIFTIFLNNVSIIRGILGLLLMYYIILQWSLQICDYCSDNNIITRGILCYIEACKGVTIFNMMITMAVLYEVSLLYSIEASEGVIEVRALAASVPWYKQGTMAVFTAGCVVCTSSLYSRTSTSTEVPSTTVTTAAGWVSETEVRWRPLVLVSLRGCFCLGVWRCRWSRTGVSSGFRVWRWLRRCILKGWLQ